MSERRPPRSRRSSQRLGRTLPPRDEESLTPPPLEPPPADPYRGFTDVRDPVLDVPQLTSDLIEELWPLENGSAQSSGTVSRRSLRRSRRRAAGDSFILDDSTVVDPTGPGPRADGWGVEQSGSEVTHPVRLPGLIDGRYQIVANIGEGGMGRVLKVRHRALGKDFALKIVRGQLSDDWRTREAFFREARTLSSLAHPHIVTVTDFGVDPSFGAFIVMEFLIGESLLAQIKRDGPLPLKAACDVILQTAEAVHCIHAHDIIHCDLKSENVFLCQPVAEPRRRNHVKLLDFGLSRDWHRTGNERIREKEIAGTPTHLAPERIRGRPPAPSNDIYALGVLFYEMLTGRPPFLGPTRKVMEAHLDEKPVPPSKRLGAPLEERADELVMKALAKNPADRQRDAAAFIYEVRTLMDMLGILRKRQVAGSAMLAARTAGGAVGSRERLYRDAFKRCPAPAMMLGPQGDIRLGNVALARLLGLPAEELAHATLASSLIGQQNPRVLEDLQAVVAEARSVQCQIEITRDGRRHRAVLWMSPAVHDGQVDAVHAVVYPMAMSRSRTSR